MFRARPDDAIQLINADSRRLARLVEQWLNITLKNTMQPGLGLEYETGMSHKTRWPANKSPLPPLWLKGDKGGFRCRCRFLPYKPRAMHAVAGSMLKHWRALVFSAYGRKSKPPAVRAVIDSTSFEDDQAGPLLELRCLS